MLQGPRKGHFTNKEREVTAGEAPGPAVEHGVDGMGVGPREREHARGDLGHLAVPLPPAPRHAEAVPRGERVGTYAVHLDPDCAAAAVVVDGDGGPPLGPRRRSRRPR